MIAHSIERSQGEQSRAEQCSLVAQCSGQGVIDIISQIFLDSFRSSCIWQSLAQRSCHMFYK